MNCETKGCSKCAKFYDPMGNQLCSDCIRVEVEIGKCLWDECEAIEDGLTPIPAGKEN